MEASALIFMAKTDRWKPRRPVFAAFFPFASHKPDGPLLRGLDFWFNRTCHLCYFA